MKKRPIISNFIKSKKYYHEFNAKELCHYSYCLNYYQGIKKSFPKLAQYVDTLGIDIQKPFETMPLEVDEEGFIDYIGAQYIVLGNYSDFIETKIEDIKVYLAISHPSTEILEEHFVIEVSLIRLKWTIGEDK